MTAQDKVETEEAPKASETLISHLRLFDMVGADLSKLGINPFPYYSTITSWADEASTVAWETGEKRHVVAYAAFLICLRAFQETEAMLPPDVFIKALDAVMPQEIENIGNEPYSGPLSPSPSADRVAACAKVISPARKGRPKKKSDMASDAPDKGYHLPPMDC